MNLDALLKELDFRPKLENALRSVLQEEEIAIEGYCQALLEGKPLDGLLADKEPLTRLAVMVIMLLYKYEHYTNQGVPDEIIIDTFRDVALWANQNYELDGLMGLTKDNLGWLRHILKVGIFKIGCLQYQPWEMVYLDKEGIGEDYMQFSPMQKKKLPKGSPVLNLHIQRGADLSPEAVADSLQRAETFFADCFPDKDFQAIICYTWLLYPPMLEKLPAGSKIKQFALRFDIIAQCQDEEQAKERVFAVGKRESGDKPSFLQKLFTEEPNRMGQGCGVIYLS